MANTYTVEEVAKHDKPGEDCWIIIHNIVYDVSSFNHPGGGRAIEINAGKDATPGFERAMHSAGAKSVLPRFEIGVIEQVRL
jgi:cytochrome b involved in lipid metabolism